MPIEDADLSVFADTNLGFTTGRIILPFQRTLRSFRFKYHEESVRLYWGFSEGSERFTPPNHLSTPYQPPINPLGT